MALYLLDKCISAFTTLMSPMFLGLAIHLHHWPLAIAIVVWWLASRFIKALPHIHRRPQDAWIVPVYLLFSFVMGVIKIYALVTLNRQGWLTRERHTAAPRGFKDQLFPVASWLTTAAVLALLFLGVVSYYWAVPREFEASATVMPIVTAAVTSRPR